MPRSPSKTELIELCDDIHRAATSRDTPPLHFARRFVVDPDNPCIASFVPHMRPYDGTYPIWGRLLDLAVASRSGSHFPDPIARRIHHRLNAEELWLLGGRDFRDDVFLSGDVDHKWIRAKQLDYARRHRRSARALTILRLLLLDYSTRIATEIRTRDGANLLASPSSSLPRSPRRVSSCGTVEVQ